MNCLSAADKTNGGHAVAPAVKAFVGRSNDLRMIRQPQIIIRTQIQHWSLIEQTNVGLLR
jgi:hypothetical protein